MSEPQASTPEPTQQMRSAGGDLINVPVSQVRDLFLSGQAGFDEGQTLAVPQADGTLKGIDASQADAYFRSAEGARGRVGTAGELQWQRDEAELGGLGGGLAAGAAQAAGAATLGLSSLALREFAPGAADYVQKAIEHNPTASAVGTGVGTVAPLLFTGGASAAGSAAEGGSLLARGGRLLTAPGRAATAAGEAAGELAGRALGTGALGRVASGAVSGAVEAGIGGIGQAVSDASLKNDPITAEALAAAGMNAAVFGGALGGGTSAAGLALGAVSRGAADRVLGLGRRVVDRAEGLADDVVGKGKTLLADLGEKAGGLAKGGADDALAKKADDLVEAMTGRPVGKALDDISTASALRSTGAGKKTLKKLTSYGDDSARASRDIIQDELPALVGKEKGAVLTRAEGLEATELLAAKEGKALGEVLKEADEWSATLRAKKKKSRPDYAQLVTDIKSVADEYRGVVGGDEFAKVADDIADQVHARWWGKDLQTIHQERSFLDSIRREAKGVKREAYEQVRDKIENWIERSGDELAQKMGGEFSLRYHAAKVKYARVAGLRDAYREGVESGLTAGVMGFRDSAATLAGVVAGSALGGPLGIAGGLGAYVGGKYLREYGDALVAKVARDAAVDGSLRGAVDSVREKIRQGVSSALQSGKVKAARAELGPAVDAAKGAAGAVARAGQAVAEGAKAAGSAVVAGAKAAGRGAAAGAKGAAAATYRWRDDREKAMARAERTAKAATAYAAESKARHEAANPGLRSARPDLDASVAQVNEGAAQFLAAEQPKAVLAAGPMRPRPSRATITEVEKFGRKARAVKDPTSILKFAKHPEFASSDAVKAVRRVFPALHEEMRGDVLDAAFKHKGTVDYKTAIRLSRITGVPLEPTCAPRFGRTMQALYAAADERAAQGPPPRAGGGGTSTKSQQAQTLTARLQGA